MTSAAETISFKCPPPVRERLPAAGNGRSKFILAAIEEKLARARPVQWKPTNARGRKLAARLAAGRHERGPALSVESVDRELRERRGGVQ
ncbi:MAG: hypothetical protein ABMA26_17165 [Limisphaerales bacterium]